MKKSSPRILIQQARSRADVILAFPLIERLTEHFNTPIIDIITNVESADCVTFHPLIQNVHTWSPGSSKKLRQTIKSQSYDIYICLWSHSPLVQLGRRVGIPFRFGDISNPINRLFFNKGTKINAQDLSQHQVQRNLALLRPLKIDHLPPILKEYTLAEMDIKVDALKTHLEDASKQTLLVYTGQTTNGLTIPPESIATFVTQTLDKGSWNIILVPDEKGHDVVLKSISHPRLLNLQTSPPFMALMSLLNVCDAYVGPDTDLMQAGSIMGKPMIVISQSQHRHPGQWGPLSDPFQIIRKDYLCDHAPTKPCTEKCLQHVSSDCLLDRLHILEKDMKLLPYHPKSTQVVDRLKNTTRILVTLRNRNDYYQLRPIIKHFKRQGLTLFPYYIPLYTIGNIHKLMRYCLRHNINVIHDPHCPTWAQTLLRVLMRIGRQAAPPLHLNMHLNTRISVKGYLEAIGSLWKLSPWD